MPQETDAEEIGRLEHEIEQLPQEIERLRRALEEALRAAKGQAAPHARGAPRENPKRGCHPRQTSDASGAAASQVGPRAVALATQLNKQLGLPYGKTAVVLPADYAGGAPWEHG